MRNRGVFLVAVAVAGWATAAAPPAIAWLPLTPESAAECPVRLQGNVREVAAGIGRTALFSGARDDLAGFDAPTFSNLTVAAWVKMDGLGQGDKPYPRIVETLGFYLHLTGSQSGVALAGLTFGAQVNGGVSSWSVDESVATGRWAHVAVSCPGGGASGVPTFYVNGRRLAGRPTPKTRMVKNIAERESVWQLGFEFGGTEASGAG